LSNNPGDISLGHTILISAISAAVFAFTVHSYSSWQEGRKVKSKDREALLTAQQRILALEMQVKSCKR